jgi:hypothetical protein
MELSMSIAKEGVFSPNDFSGSDSERINQAIDAAAEAGGGRVVIPRQNNVSSENLWVLDSAILLKEHITLELHQCHIRLADNCRDNFIRSANCVSGLDSVTPMEDVHIKGIGKVILEGPANPRATGDSGKIIGEHTFGTDAGNADESTHGDWRNIGILLVSVSDFTIENLHIKDSNCWAISLEYCTHGRVSNIYFASTGTRVINGEEQTILNQDGLDLRCGCQYIIIENITGFTGDDLIALTAIPWGPEKTGQMKATEFSALSKEISAKDFVHHITIRNVCGTCSGGHHVVRFLNTSGIKMHDIILDGVLDTSVSPKRCRAAVKIGDSNVNWGGVTPLGDTTRFFIRNISSNAQHCVLIAGSLTDSLIDGVVANSEEKRAITYQSGPEYVDNVQITNILS